MRIVPCMRPVPRARGAARQYDLSHRHMGAVSIVGLIKTSETFALGGKDTTKRIAAAISSGIIAPFSVTCLRIASR
jgi:hypothetical protein